MEKNEDGMLPAKITISIELPYEVKNINDDFIDRDRVIAIAKAAAMTAALNEVERQFAECSNDGTLPEGWRIERD